jgi:hypothetical protein
VLDLVHAGSWVRTVLWGWAGKPVDDETLETVAALRSRVVALLDNPVMPTPDRRRPIPWPAF